MPVCFHQKPDTWQRGRDQQAIPKRGPTRDSAAVGEVSLGDVDQQHQDESVEQDVAPGLANEIGVTRVSVVNGGWRLGDRRQVLARNANPNSDEKYAKDQCSQSS